MYQNQRPRKLPSNESEAVATRKSISINSRFLEKKALKNGYKRTREYLLL